jgi:hypothetical protein
MLHELASLVEQVIAPVGGFRLVLDHMGKRGLANLVGETRALGCPIAKGRAEAMHRHALDLHAAEDDFERHHLAITERGLPGLCPGKTKSPLRVSSINHKELP